MTSITHNITSGNTKKPGTRWINVSRIEVDESYQRGTLNEKNIAKFAREFSWAAFGSLNIADRFGSGHLFVVDGQHRLEVARRCGIEQVPCTIWISEGREHEAKEFRTCNKDRATVTSYNLYRASLVEGNPLYVKCEKMLSRLGLKVAQSNCLHVIAFPATLIRTFAVDAGVCESALIFQRAMVGEHEGIAENIHKGLFGLFMKMVAEGSAIPDMNRAQRVFAEGGKPLILNSIRRTHLESGVHGESTKICAIGVREAINSVSKRGKIRVDLGDVA